jgi:DNA-binding NarL/FixJ family response regulator
MERTMHVITGQQAHEGGHQDPQARLLAPMPWAPGTDPRLIDQLQQVVLQLMNAVADRARRGDWPVAEPTDPMQAGGVRPGPKLSGAAALPVRLSSREREVLQHIATGHSNKGVARVLALSPHTVKRHVANILDKLGVQSRGQAAAWWLSQR